MENTNTNKATYKSAVKFALDNLPNAPADVKEKLAGLLASLEKKSGAERKPTANQIANEGHVATLIEFLRTAPEPMLAGDIIKAVPEFAEFSTSKMSALLSKAIAAGEVERVTEKRRSYFRIAH